MTASASKGRLCSSVERDSKKIVNLTVSLAVHSKTDSQVFGELELFACDGDVGYRDGEVGEEEDGQRGREIIVFINVP
jgi:hypothetical protein